MNATQTHTKDKETRATLVLEVIAKNLGNDIEIHKVLAAKDEIVFDTANDVLEAKQHDLAHR